MEFGAERNSLEDSAMSVMCFGDSCKSADHNEIAVIRLWMDLVVIEMDLTQLSSIFFITVDIIRLPRNPKICT